MRRSAHIRRSGWKQFFPTDKYRRLVEAAKRRSFDFHLIYVLLDSPDRNVERVRLRVAKGGHDVPEERVWARYVRSLAQLPWFFRRADRAWVFDNSGATPRLISEKRDGRPVFAAGVLSQIVDALAAAAIDAD